MAGMVWDVASGVPPWRYASFGTVRGLGEFSRKGQRHLRDEKEPRTSAAGIGVRFSQANFLELCITRRRCTGDFEKSTYLG